MITTSQRSSGPVPVRAFDPIRTRRILESACHRAGLTSAGAELLRHHTNAVYRLSAAPVVVKIDRPPRAGTRLEVVGLVRWLRTQDIPAVPPAAVAQPLRIDGCAVTFWRYLPQGRDIEAADLAEPLKRLHTLRIRPAQWLPSGHLADTFARIRYAVDTSPILSAADRLLLHDHRRRLAASARGVGYELRPGLIHGDAHHRNTLWDNSTGSSVLCDWESVAVGRPEWDLVTVEVHCRRFGHDEAEYRRFCRAYGLDIRDWSGFGWLRDLRELRMITTNACKSAPGSVCAREVLRRVDGLRAGAPVSWNIL